MSSDSESEAPEVFSTSKLKSEREQEIIELFSQKRKLKEELKQKRKLKHEKYAAQKKEKLTRQQQLLQHDQDEEEGKEEENVDSEIPDDTEPKNQDVGNNGNVEADELQLELPPPPPKLIRNKKFYPKYNVMVDSLKALKDPRAYSALSFRERRLGKVHREQVASTLISYQEKMRVKNAK